MTTYHRRWALSDVYRLFDNPPPKHNLDVYEESLLKRLRRKDATWFGTDLAPLHFQNLHGCPEAWERLQVAMRALGRVEVPRTQSILRVRSFGIDGDELDADRRDVPEQWARRRRALKPSGSATLKVAVQANANANARADSFGWLGLTAVALVDLLEQAGWSVELIWYTYINHQFSGPDSPTTSLHEVVIKEAGDPVNPRVLANTIGWPGFFRWWGFRIYMEAPWRLTYGLGHSNFSRPNIPDSDGVRMIVIQQAFDLSKSVEAIRNAIKSIGL